MNFSELNESVQQLDNEFQKLFSGVSDLTSLLKLTLGSKKAFKIRRKSKFWTQENVKKNPSFNKTYARLYLRQEIHSHRVTTVSLPSHPSPESMSNFPLIIQQVDLEQEFQVLPSTSSLELQDNQLGRLAWKMLLTRANQSSISLSSQNFVSFFSQLYFYYNFYKNSFHNIRHGVNVAHSCYIITALSKTKIVFDPFQRFIMVMAGLCHDVGHTGHTNSFQISSQSDLAVRYNDRSVLQNHHASLTFQILKKTQNQFFQINNIQKLRRWIISLILATDNSYHFSSLQQFQNFQENPTDEATKIKIGGLIVHCCDFAGSTKSIDQSIKWSKLVNLQFSKQFQEQKQLGLQVTPYFKDLQIEEVRLKSEIGFITAIVLPIWLAMSQYLQDGLKEQVMSIEAYLDRMKAQIESGTT